MAKYFFQQQDKGFFAERPQSLLCVSNKQAYGVSRHHRFAVGKKEEYFLPHYHFAGR